MKISNISFKKLELDLSQPYTIAYETVSKTTNYILRCETDNGLAGFGCSAPDIVVTNEEPEDVEKAINDIIIPCLTNSNPFHYFRILHELKNELGKRSSSLAMADMALFDLISKKAGVPLYQFLGGFRESIPTSITIGILSLKETLKQAEQYVKNGFFIIKLKGGLNVDEDIEKILTLKKTYPKIILRFDGNQGYSIDESVYFYESTKSAEIEIFEQPISIENEIQMGEVSRQISIPVMADESLKSLKDVYRFVKHNRIDMINIKLMKVGGILEATHINSVAKAANMEVMIGCIDECELGIAAGLHFALSRPNIEFADLDGHLDLLGDPFKNLFTLEKGILSPLQIPGIGITDMQF
ncbi:MAG: dipeptide epimerase [Melioribacteraceae bacterium]|nr:dipeptide epimerase [Melioribacteraceae bacterium]